MKDWPEVRQGWPNEQHPIIRLRFTLRTKGKKPLSDPECQIYLRLEISGLYSSDGSRVYEIDLEKKTVRGFTKEPHFFCNRKLLEWSQAAFNKIMGENDGQA